MSLLINTATEGARNFEVVLSDFGSISRESALLAVGQRCAAGTVLGRITAAVGVPQYALHDPDASDGTEVASAVLLNNADATTTAQGIVVLARLAEVKTDLLLFKAGSSAGAKATAIAALATHNVIAR